MTSSGASFKCEPSINKARYGCSIRMTRKDKGKDKKQGKEQRNGK